MNLGFRIDAASVIVSPEKTVETNVYGVEEIHVIHLKDVTRRQQRTTASCTETVLEEQEPGRVYTCDMSSRWTSR